MAIVYANRDMASILQKSVQEAVNKKTPVQIIGGNSKAFYGRKVLAEPLQVGIHQGLVNYQPSELVITARCGTRLSEIEEILAEQGQMLAFEPPHFAATATLGGTVACGLSGSRRAFTGSVRDFVLGCKIINGQGEILSFGGEVIKNVAGYDVSRLMTGSLGTLGVILEVSLKVLPKPAVEMTRCFEVNNDEVIQTLSKFAAYALPISGLASYQGILYLRLSGSEKSVQAAARKIGGSGLSESNDFWQQLREQELAFFHQQGDLWRVSLAPATTETPLSGDWFYDWAGALRWLKSDESAEQIFTAAEQANGHAQMFRGDNVNSEVFQPLPDRLQQLNQNIKQAFDPVAIFNPMRMYRQR